MLKYRKNIPKPPNSADNAPIAPVSMLSSATSNIPVSAFGKSISAYHRSDIYKIRD
jgi:hypothetical protein